jgi:hypothetical protein
MDAAALFSQSQEWFGTFPVDEHGVPTTHAAHRVINYFLENHRGTHIPERVADSLLLPRAQTACICRQLEFIDVLCQDPPDSGKYRYQLHSRQVDLQAKIEVSLIDCSEGFAAYDDDAVLP